MQSRLFEGRRTELYSLLIVHLRDEWMIDLGYTNIIFVNFFISEPKLTTQTKSPAVKTTILRKNHRMLLTSCDSNHVNFSKRLISLAQPKADRYRLC